MIITLLIEKFVLALATILPLVVAIAFYTVTERKIIAAVQRRRGPNIVGPWGLLQAFADGIKLLIKEVILPSKANILLFIFAPLFIFAISLLNWAFIPFSNFEIISDFKFGILGLLALSSLSIYGIIFAGWSSNSRYPFIGAIRSAAQIVSYELSLTFIILTVLLIVNSLNSIEIINSQTIPFSILFPPLFLIFILTILAETNRAPFDLPEAEAEIVAGYNLEYSSIPFALFFLGEYSNIILMSTLTVILFFGSWAFIVNKILIISLTYILIRATLPRLRYDQLIHIGWKIFLPILFGYFIITIGLLISFTNYNLPLLQIDQLIFPFIFTLWKNQQNLTPKTQQCNTHMVFFIIGLLTQIAYGLKSLFIWLGGCIVTMFKNIAAFILTIAKTVSEYFWYAIDQLAACLIYLGGYLIVGGIHLIGTIVLVYELTISTIIIVIDQLGACLIYLGGYLIVGGIHLIGTVVLVLLIIIEQSVIYIITFVQTHAIAATLLKWYLGCAFFSYVFVFIIYLVKIFPDVRDAGEFAWHWTSDSRFTKRTWLWFKVWFPIQCKAYVPNFIQRRWYEHFNSLFEVKELNYELGYKFDYKFVRFFVIITHVVPIYVVYYVTKYAIFPHIGWTGFIGACLAYSIAFLLTSIHPTLCPDYLFTVIVEYVNFHLKDPQLSSNLMEALNRCITRHPTGRLETIQIFSNYLYKLVHYANEIVFSTEKIDYWWGWQKVGKPYIWDWHHGNHNKYVDGEYYMDALKHDTKAFFDIDCGIHNFINHYGTSLAFVYSAGKLATISAGIKSPIAAALVVKITTLVTNAMAAKLAFIIKCVAASKFLGISLIKLYHSTIHEAWKISKIHDWDLRIFLWSELQYIIKGFIIFRSAGEDTGEYSAVLNQTITHIVNKIPLELATPENWNTLNALVEKYMEMTPDTHAREVLARNFESILLDAKLIPATLLLFLTTKSSHLKTTVLQQKKNFSLKIRQISFGKTKLGRITRRLRWYSRQVITFAKNNLYVLLTFLWLTAFLTITVKCFLLIAIKGYYFIDLGLYPYNLRPLLIHNTVTTSLVIQEVDIAWVLINHHQIEAIHNLNKVFSYDNIFTNYTCPRSLITHRVFTEQQLIAIHDLTNVSSSYHSAFNNYVCSHHCPRSLITYRVFTETFPCIHPNCYFPFIHGHREHWTFNPRYSAIYYIVVPLVTFFINWIRFTNKRANLPDDVDIEFTIETQLLNVGLFIWHGLLAAQALYMGDYIWIADPHTPILQYMLLDEGGNDLCAHCLRPVFDRTIHTLKFLAIGPSPQSFTTLLKLSASYGFTGLAPNLNE